MGQPQSRKAVTPKTVSATFSMMDRVGLVIHVKCAGHVLDSCHMCWTIGQNLNGLRWDLPTQIGLVIHDSWRVTSGRSMI